MSMDYDLIILGAGPAGEGAAINAVKAGKSVAVVEDKNLVGGNCTHLGTIPSKSLRHAVKQIYMFNTDPMFRNFTSKKVFNFKDIAQRAQDVIKEQVKARTQYYTRNRITLFNGVASFIDEHTISIVDNENNREKLTAKSFLIATGSRPYRPDDVDFNHPRIFDSDTILSLNETPRRIIIYGAGVIGCEYASIFSNMGALVDLVDTRDRLLSFLDVEVSEALSYHLRNNNVIIRHDEEYQKVEAQDSGVRLYLKSGKIIKANVFLWANGRTGNVKRLNLEKIGLTADSRGRLAVDNHYRTSVSHIYAAGDVIGWPSLASASYNQGRFAASNMDVPANAQPRTVASVPTGIYTIPEISSLGKTEEELTANQIPYEVGKAWFSKLARAQITGETVGMLKLLFHRDNHSLLGIHCFGDQASEIVHIGQAIMNQNGNANRIEYFLYTTFNYPTMAEAYRVAALDGLSRL